MKVAVTGPTGMIGSELVQLLLDRGDDVIAIVNPDSKRIANLSESEHLSVVRCKMTDYKTIEGTESCDIFFHLAWMSSNVNERDDVYTQLDNIRCSLDAVRLADSWGAKVFVGTGSQAEYGRVESTIDCNTPSNPESGYGIAKSSCERLCRLYCKKLKMKFFWTRIVSVFGKNDMDHTLIMYLIKTIMSGNRPILTKCEQIWDYMYVKDCANALIHIAEKGDPEKIYPIASGHSEMLRNYVETIRDMIDPDVELGFGEKDYYPHQPMFLSVDISQLKKDTGFEPAYSFKDGVKEVIDYIRAHSE